jgi:hypothetical protein
MAGTVHAEKDNKSKFEKNSMLRCAGIIKEVCKAIHL